MTSPALETIDEVDFCATMASAMNAIFAANPHYDFVEARIEGMGSTKSKLARKDLRLFGPDNRIVLTGEVKLPGSVGAPGRTLFAGLAKSPRMARVAPALPLARFGGDR